jgi:Sortase domain
MTTVPKRFGKRAAYGTAAIIVAVATLLAGESAARAATESHAPQVPQQVRNIWYERPIRNVGEKPSRKNPARKKPARKKPARKRPAQAWTIDIPSIAVAAGLMRLGGAVSSTGGLSLPTPPLAKAASAAGWYQFSAVPGTAGNAVIVGHVDTYVGPGIFYNLYQLVPGDAIYVSAGGRRQRFDVTSDREMSKASFPVNQVFGRTRKHMLWLITCGGAFDYNTRHYVDNIVVSAALVAPHGKSPRHT